MIPQFLPQWADKTISQQGARIPTVSIPLATYKRFLMTPVSSSDTTGDPKWAHPIAMYQSVNSPVHPAL